MMAKPGNESIPTRAPRLALVFGLAPLLLVAAAAWWLWPRSGADADRRTPAQSRSAIGSTSPRAAEPSVGPEPIAPSADAPDRADLEPATAKSVTAPATGTPSVEAPPASAQPVTAASSTAPGSTAAPARTAGAAVPSPTASDHASAPPDRSTAAGDDAGAYVDAAVDIDIDHPAADEPMDATPPATADAPGVRDAWLTRIRALFDSGDIAGGRASLRAFAQRYPDYPLPEDLRALLR